MMLAIGMARLARSGEYGVGRVMRTVDSSTASTESIQSVMKSAM
jgi:hypothetical protein